MILWIILTLMIAVAAVGLAVPLIRPGGRLDRRTTSAQVLKAQLADLDRQAEAGTAPEADLAALRLEVERRALAVCTGGNGSNHGFLPHEQVFALGSELGVGGEFGDGLRRRFRRRA